MTDSTRVLPEALLAAYELGDVIASDEFLDDLRTAGVYWTRYRKRCARCGELKLSSEYFRTTNPNSCNGFKPHCKACVENHRAAVIEANQKMRRLAYESSKRTREDKQA